eukprot:CAMPEP_0167753950 /NCGR_PEP_ID=MMETSP0110_2-20121227/7998_1 /TAXON_ID=629695 /ORGANISM="Gymnochlora sp., Strain CCMP2014" /LENGTH=123 /DNA_ID=CAMNT_0007639773 /DNA_START=284 /DNA_END=655 /DNA_ORIENTATION=+
MAMPQVDGDYEFLKELLDDFLDDFKNRKEKILKNSKEAKASSMDNLRKDAHTVKGSALNLGLARFAKIAKALEDTSREAKEMSSVSSSTMSKVAKLVEELILSAKEVADEHQGILKKHEAQSC